MSSHTRTLPPRRLIRRVLAAAMFMATLLGAVALSPGAAGAATTPPPKGDLRLWQISDPQGYHDTWLRGQADFAAWSHPYYHMEGQSGRVYSPNLKVARPGLGVVPIYRCVNDGAPAPRYFAFYVSRDPNCEHPHRGDNSSIPITGTISFYVWPNQIAGTHPIYRCHRPEAFDWIATASTNCEGRPGYFIQQILGYAFW